MATKRILLPQSLAAAFIIFFALLPIAVSTQAAVRRQHPKPAGNNQANVGLRNPKLGNKNTKPTTLPRPRPLPRPLQRPLPRPLQRPLPTANGNAGAGANGFPENKKQSTDELINEFLSSHNMARIPLGLPPFTWNHTVAKYAEQWAKQRMKDCKLTHSEGDYGENLFWALRSHWTPGKAVKIWIDEKADYDPKSNKCVKGKMCGHYTQIVWKDTVSVGCARVECYNGLGIFVACNYYPPGNYIDEHPFGSPADVQKCLKKFAQASQPNQSAAADPSKIASRFKKTLPPMPIPKQG